MVNNKGFVLAKNQGMNFSQKIHRKVISFFHNIIKYKIIRSLQRD